GSADSLRSWRGPCSTVERGMVPRSEDPLCSIEGGGLANEGVATAWPSPDGRAPLGGGRAKIENSSRRHPGKFGAKRFLVVREVAGAVSGVACFWATSLEKIFGGVIAIISFRPGGWMQQSAVPRCAILLVRKHGRHRAVRGRGVHNVARWCGGLPGRCARAAAAA